MSKGFEYELKYELTEAGYRALLAELEVEGAPNFFRNTYYTVAATTSRQDWVLRLRSWSEGPAELTLKVGKREPSGLFSSVEYTAVVTSNRPREWENSEPLRVLRADLTREELKEEGSIDNVRYRMRPPFGPAPYWELDHARLSLTEELFELEIEYPAEKVPPLEEIMVFEQELTRWVQGLGVTFEASRKTKYQRFLEALKK